MQWLFGNDELTQSIVSCCARLKTSTLFEDKVIALNELSALSKEHPLEVGIKSIGTICDDVLIGDSSGSDAILTGKCIDILVLLLLPPEEPYSAGALPRHPQTQRVYYECNLDLLFTPHSVSGDRCSMLIALLREDLSEFIEMQYNIIQILTVILLYCNTRHKLRTELINIYGAMNTLSHLLDSPHEFIRNSCLILLAHLCANDASIQKLIAFDGAFERVLAISKKEDGIEGGMVVHDCLYLMDNLLRNNESNQKYFVEIGCVEQLKEVFPLKFPLKQEEVAIVDRVMNIVMQITRNCGSQNNTQNALGALVQPLLQIIGANNEYNVLKQKCLVLLCIILYLNTSNINQVMRCSTLNDEHPLLLITKLSLHGYKLNDAVRCDPIQSLLSLRVLKSILTQNRALQQVLTEAFIACANNTKNTSVSGHKWDTAFGSLMFSMFSMRSTKDGFGDPLRYWMMTRVFSLLLSDNNNCKMYVLNKYNFVDIVMHSLVQITRNAKNETYDERIQIALLLLICSICYECRHAIYALFGSGNKEHMLQMISLAKGDNVYSAGLSTYLIAICMEFARDLTPTNTPQSKKNTSAFSPYLFWIIHDQIGLERFKLNLDKLRSCPEYTQMIGVIEACKEKMNSSHNARSDEEERSKRLLIEEIFLNEFNIENDEYLVYKNNRMRVQLFDSVFVKQLEAIYSLIDKRIIQLISSAKPTINKPQNTIKTPHTNSNEGNNDNELKQMKIRNEDLSTENKGLKKQIADFKKNENDILNSKISEINELRKQLQMQINNTSDNCDTNGDTNVTQKYNTLRKTYDALNRDHEDLLVFVGHLHDKYEEIQKEYNEFKQNKT